MTAPLNSTVAYACVAGDIASVYAAVHGLTQRLWAGMTEVVHADPPRVLFHHVAIEGDDIDAWLTWELAPTGPSDSWTEVRLIHEELDTSSGPPPELDELLTLLVESLGVVSARQ